MCGGPKKKKIQDKLSFLSIHVKVSTKNIEKKNGIAN